MINFQMFVSVISHTIRHIFIVFKSFNCFRSQIRLNLHFFIANGLKVVSISFSVLLQKRIKLNSSDLTSNSKNTNIRNFHIHRPFRFSIVSNLSNNSSNRLLSLIPCLIWINTNFCIIDLGLRYSTINTMNLIRPYISPLINTRFHRQSIGKVFTNNKNWVSVLLISFPRIRNSSQCDIRSCECKQSELSNHNCSALS